MPGPSDTQVTADEAVAVRCWVLDRLREEGRFTDVQATLLVVAGADYHKALEMLDAGCSAELAVAILT